MDETRAAAIQRRNRRAGIGLATVVVGMVGLAFAAVPLYDLFCRVTGYNGTVQTGAAAPGATGRTIQVRFAAQTDRNLPWSFQPEQASMTVRLGEEGLAFYTANNRADTPVTGISVYNVTPEKVGRYFHKVACFCFDEQTLTPGQRVDMPLSFWVDPRIAEDPNTRDVTTITLSYTFFRTIEDAERAGALANAGAHVGRAGTRAN
ncbi:cytochrome c oxidase assembly protein [Roseomonas terrae]|uniref:Cytochrome c oxidase assembly protein CtaG n=1 Tax=Neoroseomonas terrae TaxID=424799 RepID=A0ABS5EN59_9PROT|nr:cytochrome c oxidase assembly protein [Neoroseomonas terrae]MBR0652456.1 cytochrome c oxidase assembly protein [Neoroseomonas terrae]